MSDMQRLLRLFRPYRVWMIIGVVLSFFTLFANIALLTYSGWFVASMVLAGAAGLSVGYSTAIIIGAMAVFRTIGRYVERLVTHEATFRLLAQLRVWFYSHLEPLAPARLQNYQAGDLLSRIRADIDVLENFYLRFLVPVVVAAAATPLIAIAIGHYLSVELALTTFSLMVVSGLGLPLLTDKMSHAAARRQVETKARMRAQLVEQKQGLGELLIYGALEQRQAEVAALSNELLNDQRRIHAVSGVMQGGQIIAAGLAVWGVLLFITPLVESGALQKPYFAMAILFVLASFEAVMATPQAIHTLPMVQAASRRLFEIIDAEPKVRAPARPAKLAAQKADIELSHVNFAYRDEGPLILEDISLSLPQGKKLALVGPTGSGKSSIINLLLRFWPPQDGEISINGRNVGDYAPEDVRRLFATAPQRIHLFNTTIRENLLLADGNATPEELEKACRLACIHDFIKQQPDGYDAYVGEAGLKLSGGQVRRLGVARALLKKTPILLLDEPGEGLDPALEHKLLANLLSDESLNDNGLNGGPDNNGMGGRRRSVILITHSLTGLDQMDEVIVLEDGHILQRGDHNQLMEKDGAYRQLHNLLGEYAVMQ